MDTNNRRTLAAAILAGGHARRLGGVNKGTLRIGDAAIIDRQLDALRAVTSEIFVVGRPDPAWTARGLRVVADEIPDTGPLGGIYTALVQSPAERTLIVACDMPFVTADLLTRLARVEGADVVVARSARGLEPLCAIYSRVCARDIRDRLARGEYEASRLPAGVSVADVSMEDALVFVNINTPHDVERARDLVERELEPNKDRITTGRDRPVTDTAS